MRVIHDCLYVLLPKPSFSTPYETITRRVRGMKVREVNKMETRIYFVRGDESEDIGPTGHGGMICIRPIMVN